MVVGRSADDWVNVLGKWVVELAANPGSAFPGRGQLKPEGQELERLRRENAKLKAERDIQKKRSLRTIAGVTSVEGVVRIAAGVASVVVAWPGSLFPPLDGAIMGTSEMKRRELLCALCTGAGALAIAGRASAGAAVNRLDPANPLDRSFIFRRLAYASGPTPRFSWLRGTRYALVDTDLIPLWEMHVGTIFQVHERPDASPGSYDVTAMSTSFYTDLHTGAFLKTFKNPFTGKTVPVGYYPPRPAKLAYTVDGLLDPPGRLPPGLTTIGRLGPTWIEGDVVCTAGDNLVLSGSGAPRVRVNDLSTYVGSLKAVMDPAVAMPPADLTFSDINTWPSWLQMEDQPGNYYSRAVGRKELTFQALPALWRTLLASEYPAVARDPIAALAG